jgi:hypothetical protein
MIRYASLLLAISIGLLDVRATEVKLSSVADIERLALSIALTEFPIQQGKMVDVVGDPSYSPMIWGDYEYQYAALTDPKSPMGFFAVRCVYKEYEKLPPPDKIEVLSEEIVFLAPNQMCFVYEQNRQWTHELPNLKEKMKKMGLKPREFAAMFYKLTETGEDLSNQKPPLPTPASGTPSAGAPVVPPSGAAGR